MPPPVQRMWAPWRLEYVAGDPPAHQGCIFCEFPLGADPGEQLIVGFSSQAFVILNRFPYNNGHIMVVPRRHVASLALLEAAERADLFDTVARCETFLRDTYHCGGLNVGLNLGRAAGAGIEEHLHVHLVPRWAADTNFMPVLADVRVIMETLTQTRDRLIALARPVGLAAECPWKQ